MSKKRMRNDMYNIISCFHQVIHMLEIFMNFSSIFMLIFLHFFSTYPIFLLSSVIPHPLTHILFLIPSLSTLSFLTLPLFHHSSTCPIARSIQITITNVSPSCHDCNHSSSAHSFLFLSLLSLLHKIMSE